MNPSFDQPENPFVSHDLRRAFLFRSYRQLDAPIIVLGMHRSGTSILAEMLQMLGVYIGRKLSQHSEPLYIAQLNDKLLEMAGATWYKPESYLEKTADPAFYLRATETIRESLDCHFSKQFLGLEHRFSLTTFVPQHWGFKDPRTCLTLPQWLEVFPKARLIHIARHPLDVAISIQRREEQRQKEGYDPIAENLDIDRNLQVWEQYVSAARRTKNSSSYYLEFRFEDLLADPAQRLTEVMQFCGMEPNSGRLATAAAMADADRTRRYEDDRYAPWREKVSTLPSAREFHYT